MAVLALVAAVAVVGLGGNLVVTALYWGDDYDGIELEATGYEDEVDGWWADYAAIEQEIFDNADQAGELPSELDELVETCNGYLETYFQDVYGIEVASLIDEVEVHTFDFSGLLDLVGIWGMEDPDGGNIYISTEITDELTGIASDSSLTLADANGNPVEYEYIFMEVYIHEIIHDLGCCAQLDNEMTMVYEGMCEYLTGQCLEYNGVDYTNMTSYTYNSVIGGQIIEADPDLVVAMIGHYGEFRLGDRLDEQLEGYALDLDDALFVLVDQQIEDADMLLRAQYIAAEYCKAVNADAAQSIVDGNEIVSFFEVKVLLNGLG